MHKIKCNNCHKEQDYRKIIDGVLYCIHCNKEIKIEKDNDSSRFPAIFTDEYGRVKSKGELW